jgi:hypothetical protein
MLACVRRHTGQQRHLLERCLCPLLSLRYGSAWSFATCDFFDFNGWADAANEVLRAKGVPVDSYPYK